jgi:hypothetical protein
VGLDATTKREGNGSVVTERGTVMKQEVEVIEVNDKKGSVSVVDGWDMVCIALTASSMAVFPFAPFLCIGQWALRHTGLGTNTVAMARTIAKKLPSVQMIPSRLPLIGDKVASAPTKAITTTETEFVSLDSIAKADNILVVGNKGSGKSTLLNALITQRIKGEAVVVFDPHYTPGAWTGAKVIGAGRDYEGIEHYLTGALRMLSERYSHRANSAIPFGRITFCGDEYRSISLQVPSAGASLMALMTEGRKVRMCVIAASHNDTVASLGCKGDKESFVTSFDWIIYTGAFAKKRIGGATPMIATPDGDIPAYAYCWNQNRQEAFLLDLRTIVETSQKESDSEVLSRLLLGENASNGVMVPVKTNDAPELSTARHETTTAIEDQSHVVLDRSVSQSKTGRGQARRLPDAETIRKQLESLGSKNKVFEWLKTEYGIRGKGTAYAIIAAAEEQEDIDIGAFGEFLDTLDVE